MPSDEVADDDPLSAQPRSLVTSQPLSMVPPLIESPFPTLHTAVTFGHTVVRNKLSGTVDLDKITRETEPIQKASELTVTIHDGLTGTRAAVIDDTGPTIPEISVLLFFDIVLPQPSILDHVRAIFTALTKGDRPPYNPKGRRWSAFPRDPAKASLRENTVYKKLEKIYHAVLEAAQDHAPAGEPTTTFTNTPDYVPKSDWRGSTSKPDGFFALRNRRAGGSPHWMDIVATGEYKRNDKDKRNLEDDSKKVLWNMHQTMRNDPCRRFTFGFTIENREMRIWYASRADILVSSPFDFMSDPILLIKFFLIFSFTDIYGLGWDPSMRCIWRGPEETTHYIINVRSETTGEETEFLATDVLSNIGADPLRGRGTRVFKVHQLENGVEVGNEMALKDCWMDADRTREGEIMSSIIQDATKAGSKENIQELEEGLLSVFIHGDVHIAGKLDRTLTKDQRSELFAEDGLFLVHRSDLNKKKFEALLKKGLQERAAKGSHRSKSDFIHRSNLSPIMYCPKKHYRIVFKEACKPLSQETSLCRIFFILGIVCRILKAMHETGWVHRDISIGNIMTFNNTVKFADVEYAKRIGQTTGGHNEIRTGTADFMSIEVHHMRYMFPRPCSQHAAPVRKPVQAFRDLILQPRHDAGPAPNEDIDSPLIPWFYNPLHDMESMFWLMAYYVLFRDVYLPDSPRFPPPFAEESDAERARRIKAQFEFVQCLFVQRDLSERQALMMVHNSLSDKLKEAPLHPALRPIGVCLLQARSALHNAYTNAEKSLPILLTDASSIASDLYMDFPSILHEMRQRLVDAGVGNLQGRHLSEAYGAIVVEEEERRQQKRQTVRETQTRLRRESEWNEYMAQNTIDEPAARTTGTLKRKQPPRSYAQDDSLRRSKRIANRVVQFVESDDEEDTHVRPSRRSTKKAASSAPSKKRKRGGDEDVADTTVKPARKVARLAKDASPATRPKPTSRKPTAGSSTREGNGGRTLPASKRVPALTNPAGASRQKTQAVDEIRPVVGRVLRPRKHK